MNPHWAWMVWALVGLGTGITLASVTRRCVHSTTRHWLLRNTLLGPVTAVLFGLLAWRIGVRPELIADSAVAAVGVPLSAIDLMEQRMPSALMMPGYVMVLAALTTATVLDHRVADCLRALAALAITGTGFLCVALISAARLGAADIRWAGLLAMVLGWRSWAAVVEGILLGLICAAIVGACLIATRRINSRDTLALGPPLLAGTLAVLVLPLR